MADSHELAMYMLWTRGGNEPPLPLIPNAYRLATVVSEDVDKARSVVEMDGPVSDVAWSRFRDSIVPDGMFVVEERATSTWVGTISAIHNPAATRFYFPGGGELGYLVVAPEYRRQGLGAALIVAAVTRLLQGKYRHIFLGVQGWRLPAVRSYLNAGFQPFIHSTDLVPRWRAVFAALGRKAVDCDWPTRLPAANVPLHL